MKTLGEQAAEKIGEKYTFPEIRHPDVQDAIAQIIDTLHAQQPCCGCEKLREAARQALYALEQLDMKPMNCLAYIRGLREALAQPCQPASVGSEEWTEETVQNIRSVSGDISDQQAIADAHNAALRRQSAPRKGGDAPCPSTLKDSPGSSGKPTSSTPAAADVCQGCGEYYYECSCQSAPVEAWRDLGLDEQPREGDRLLCVEEGQVRASMLLCDYSQKGFWQRRVTQGGQANE